MWLIFKFIKALEVIIIHYFADNTTFLCFYLSFLITDLYYLVPAVIAQILNPIVELVMPVGTPSKGAKGKIKIHLLTPEANLRNFFRAF